MATAGVAQSAAGALALRRFWRQREPALSTWPAVTVLKPLHGDEPLLEAALATFCAQDYPEFQVVFGVQDASDPALATVARLRARFPHVNVDLVVDRTTHGRNRKVGNLINMFGAARHDVLLISDSDVHAPPTLLRSVVAALREPDVGVVTTLYTGLPGNGSLVAQLGAAWISRDFLPGALLGRALGRQDCLGANMALTRRTLDRIGGFEALVDHVADDALLGKLVRAQGLHVALARSISATTVNETRLPDLFGHELRWMRTMRSVAPAGFPTSAVQYPLFWAALMVLLTGQAWALAGFGLVWWLRAILAHLLDRALPAGRTPLMIWCLPLRDILSITVMLASYMSDRVAWRGQQHHVTRFSRPVLEPHEEVV